MSKLPNVTVYKIDDIINLIGYNDDVKNDVIKEIITQYDTEMGVALSQNKIVSIPYIGNFRKNLSEIEFNKKKLLLKIAKDYMSKEELKRYAAECRIEANLEAHKKDRIRVLIRKNIISNRKKYEKLIKEVGIAYANMYIFSITCFDIVKFDQEVEDAWQEIWRLENET